MKCSEGLPIVNIDLPDVALRVHRSSPVTMLRLALVTGASSGIGAAVSLLLARQGVTVVLVSRSSPHLTSLHHQIEKQGGRSLVMECDLTNKQEIIRMAASVKEKVGVPDLIVNNAGAYYFQLVEDRDYSTWERMINLNIMGYLVIIAEFLGDMKVEITLCINIQDYYEKKEIRLIEGFFLFPDNSSFSLSSYKPGSDSSVT